VDNTCTRPYLNDSGSSGLATVSVMVDNGTFFGSISDNSIECSDRGGIELVSRAGTNETAGYGCAIDGNYLVTESGDSAEFGIEWRGEDLSSTNPEHAASLTMNRNIVRPSPGGTIVDGIRIVCEEHTSWGSNGMSENIVDGCSGDGIALISDGWENVGDAEITVFFNRNVSINNGGSGVLLHWDPTNHEYDLGYGYIHFLAEGCLIAGNGGYGIELRGIGVNSADEVEDAFHLWGVTIADNATGGIGFGDLALGGTDPEDELLEMLFGGMRNCIVCNNDESDQVVGISGAVLDAFLSRVWNSNWEGHPAAVYTPCTQDSGDHYVIDCDPDFVDAGDGDYHLLSGSPCIDSGDNTYSGILFDLDRQDRIQDGTCPIYGTPVVDMGCDEFPQPTCSP
jgi:hypothetical protein